MHSKDNKKKESTHRGVGQRAHIANRVLLAGCDLAQNTTHNLARAGLCMEKKEKRRECGKIRIRRSIIMSRISEQDKLGPLEQKNGYNTPDSSRRHNNDNLQHT